MAVVRLRLSSPYRVWFDRVDRELSVGEELPKEALSRADIEDWRPAEALDDPDDLLMATLWMRVKGIVLGTASNDFARRRGQWS